MAAVSVGLLVGVGPRSAGAHGDVIPQPVDTAGLNNVGASWLKENPYRLKGGEQYKKAIEVGEHGYAANCARCHGLQVISGGIAPDLRYLDDGAEGDEWFMSRIRGGFSQNGTYKMPPFENVLNQEAMWAIRSYIETREK
ncbi:cytochrome c-550 PedF [Xanthobacter flavus]|nr:cytochrome c-550 PedF [Xanthobacter autotrophicus]MDI4657378.1 cytochrome c-550 PedF [Xanthobacter autotrophicus]MDI4665526.1 cytochrome c-550 PedF [Xanthobacter autotrophicus]